MLNENILLLSKRRAQLKQVCMCATIVFWSLLALPACMHVDCRWIRTWHAEMVLKSLMPDWMAFKQIDNAMLCSLSKHLFAKQ